MSRATAVRRALAGSAEVSSRWWFWVAAVPLVFAFWLLAAGWIALAAYLDMGLFTGGSGSFVLLAFQLSLVALGVPLAVLLVVFPVAVSLDARAVAEAGADWQPNVARLSAAALAGPVATAVLVAVALLGEITTTAILTLVGGITVGYLLATPVALYYLRGRRRHVGLL